MGNTPTLFNSKIGKKVFVALTGLFLIIFLIGHLSGNLQLFIPGEAGKLQFNEYAHFMTSNPAVKLLSYLTYFSILLHALGGVYLARVNKSQRPVKYAKNSAGDNSKWASRNMAILGSLIFIFIVLHMKAFWYEMHFGNIPVDTNGNKDLYTMVWAAYSQIWIVVVYVICMIILGLHLSHGFQSGFQTLGLNHKRYSPIIQKLGLGFSVLVSVLFAAIPIYAYISQLN